MHNALEELLKLKPINELEFISSTHLKNFRDTLYGGQVLAQGLKAATLTCDDKLPHSLHVYFLLPGNNLDDIRYVVEKVRDGRSFSNRMVTAFQAGKRLISMMVSLHVKEDGYSHSQRLANAASLSPPSTEHPSPDGHIEDPKARKSPPFIFESINGDIFSKQAHTSPHAQYWMKSLSTVSENQANHCCALAFVSDMGLLATSLLTHPTTLFCEDITAASVDHSLWFHCDNLNMNDWLIFSTDSPWAGAARGFTRGQFYNRKGELLASVAQEGLIRPTTSSVAK